MRIITLASRRATATAVVVALVAGVVTLGGAIGLGLRWPSGWLGSGPDDTTDFDYSALGRTLPRLRDGYVRAALDGTGAAAGASASGTSAPAARRAPVVHPFTNDDFDHAYAVRSLPFAARSDTSAATRQSGEPIDCLPAGGSSWYRYDTTGPVALFADTFGTRVATALAVYSGDRLSALNKIGCDVNALGNAQVGFLAAAGTTYWFQLTQPLPGRTTFFHLAAVGATTVQTISASGARADGIAIDHPAISADGRWVAFISKARNLTPTSPDCAGGKVCDSLYLRDRRTGIITLVATSASPYSDDDPRGSMTLPSLSADGRYVGFTGYPSVGDTPLGYTGDPDGGEQGPNANAYVYDRVTERIKLVSRNSAGEPGRRDPAVNYGPLAGSMAPSISADGRYVTFISDAANLGGPREPGKTLNAYRRDRQTGETRLTSIDANGEPMRANVCAITGRNVSGDGRFMAFLSTFGTGSDTAADAAGWPGDSATGAGTIYRPYLWDAATGRSRLIARLLPGRAPVSQGNYCIGLSDSGSHVAFVSRDALVPEDTNVTADVYVYEVAADRLRRVSITSAGAQTNDPYVSEVGIFARSVTLSADGRYAAFDSAAPDLAPGAVHGRRQVFVHDLVTGATVLASVTSAGQPLPGESMLPYIAADGRSVAFINTDATGYVSVMVHELLP